MNQVTIAIINESLKNLSNKKHFSICDIDKILEITRTIPDGESYRLLSAIHCVNYRDMSQEVLKALPELIAKVLSGPSVCLKIVPVHEVEVSASYVEKLMMLEEPPKKEEPPKIVRKRGFFSIGSS